MKQLCACIRRFAAALVCLVQFFVVSPNTKAQQVSPAILEKEWKADWITVPATDPTGYGVYYFRKEFSLSTVPSTFSVHVSGDNRYKLYVNEQLVSLGPARGDLLHWHFETIDLAPFLRPGANVIAAQVWNEGTLRMEANISHRTGFILQAGSEDFQVINTNNTWKCLRDSAYSPINVTLPTYYVTGPGERVDMNNTVDRWKQAGYDDTQWRLAASIARGVPKQLMGAYGTFNGWMLVPSRIPPMELKPERLQQVRRSTGISLPPSFPAIAAPVTIPANTVATILLDQTHLTNAYPTLEFSGGRQATISLEYAEALFTKMPAKGNRNDVEGKTMAGRKDLLISNGSKAQSFTSLTFRTYRYIELTITTKNDALVIDDIYAHFTGYPFQFNAKFESGEPELNQLLEIGWRTARLCAFETYMDCPYYEQLQYIGDARIQGLVSLYNSGDDRLLRNALDQMDHSRQTEGVTLSRHPSATPQYIPTFSLWYIGMLYDYMMYGKDVDFVRARLPGARQVLHYFSGFQQADGSLKGAPYWLFTDWVTAPGWISGSAPVGGNGNAALLDLQLLWAYQVAADMEMQIGMKAHADAYAQQAAKLSATIRQKYWDTRKQLFADRAEKDLFSQHANALAILTGVTTPAESTSIGRQLTKNPALAPASIYFKYYLHQALIKAGFGNEYVSWLDKWRENIRMGLTTWAETSDINVSRSDCHAWGSSPNIEFFRTVLGITSASPGFTKILIEPHPGALKKLSGEMPHPNGTIKVDYLINGAGIKANIELPPNTNGIFKWKGKELQLKAGINKL